MHVYLMHSSMVLRPDALRRIVLLIHICMMQVSMTMMIASMCEHFPVFLLLLLLLENRSKFCHGHTFSGSSSRSLVADYSRFRICHLYMECITIFNMHSTSRPNFGRNEFWKAQFWVGELYCNSYKILHPLVEIEFQQEGGKDKFRKQTILWGKCCLLPGPMAP